MLVNNNIKIIYRDSKYGQAIIFIFFNIPAKEILDI